MSYTGCVAATEPRHPACATSISVEPRIWDYFCIIAAERGVTIGQLLSHVDRAMRLEPTWRGKCSTRNLSSAVRVFVIEQCELKPQTATEPACEVGYLTSLNHLRSAMP